MKKEKFYNVLTTTRCLWRPVIFFLINTASDVLLVPVHLGQWWRNTSIFGVLLCRIFFFPIVPCLDMELGLAIAMQDSDPLVETVSLNILRWRQKGYIDALEKKWWDAANQCHVQKPTGRSAPVILYCSLLRRRTLGSLVSCHRQHRRRHQTGRRRKREEPGKCISVSLILPLQIFLFLTSSLLFSPKFYSFHRLLVENSDYGNFSKWCPRPENNLKMTKGPGFVFV